MAKQSPIDIKVKIATKGIFNPVYISHINNEHRIQIYFGGSSSGKSVFVSDRAVLDIIQGRNYLICRKTANTTQKSTFNEIKKSINKFQLGQHFNINKSDKIITFKPNGSQIIFVGLDDVEKVKSITPEIGVITDIWIEEATETEHADLQQLEKRLRGMSKFKKRIHITFNPILKSHWIYQTFFKGFWQEGQSYVDNDGLSILKTTYIDNDFLELEDKQALEDESDRYHYEVYTQGNWGVLGHVIYKNWKIESFDSKAFDNYKNGVDWGFSKDPFAFIRTHYDKTRNKLYICDEVCEINLLNRDSAKLIKDIVLTEQITCDSNEPKSVREFQQLGLNAFSAKKGKGSVEYGIKFLQSLEIIIHPKCQSFINEIQTYQYKSDKYGEALPTPVKKDDHLLDALRYALEWESFHMKVDIEKPITLDTIKKKDIFSKDFEELEDKLGVVWKGANNTNPYISEEFEDSSDSITGY